MTRKERSFVIEGMAVLIGGLFGSVAVPTLISAHDSVALLAAIGLLLGWICWVAYFLYRINGSKLDV